MSNSRLSKKTMTRLLNAQYRKSILRDEKKAKGKQIEEYAKFVVNSQISQRKDEYASDRDSGWGFPPLNIICAVKSDGTVMKKFLEFKTVNHFLKDKDGDAAVEVMKCILILWAEEDKSVASFDVEAISTELKKLDEEAKKQLEEQKRKEDEQEQKKAEESKSLKGTISSRLSDSEISAEQPAVQ